MISYKLWFTIMGGEEGKFVFTVVPYFTFPKITVV